MAALHSFMRKSGPDLLTGPGRARPGVVGGLLLRRLIGADIPDRHPRELARMAAALLDD